MSVIMDDVASGIIFGILLLTIAGIQVNINSTLYENTFSVRVQGNATELACQLEHDILKAGYHVTLGSALITADSTTLSFNSDFNNTGSVGTLRYSVGSPANLPNTMNPADFPLYRTMNSSTLQQNWGLINFKFAYYDSAMLHRLTTPVTGTNLSLVRAIQASFTIQSPEPVISSVDTTWPAVMWEKVMWPRNLGILQ